MTTWLPLTEFMAYTGVSKNTAYAYSTRGVITTTNRGGLKFSKEDTDAWLEERKRKSYRELQKQAA